MRDPAKEDERSLETGGLEEKEPVEKTRRHENADCLEPLEWAEGMEYVRHLECADRSD